MKTSLTMNFYLFVCLFYQLLFLGTTLSRLAAESCTKLCIAKVLLPNIKSNVHYRTFRDYLSVRMKIKVILILLKLKFMIYQNKKIFSFHAPGLKVTLGAQFSSTKLSYCSFAIGTNRSVCPWE